MCTILVERAVARWRAVEGAPGYPLLCAAGRPPELTGISLAAACTMLIAIRLLLPSLSLPLLADSALHRLEPDAGQVLHGAQQGEAQFRNYSRYLGPSAAPMAYATYHAIEALNSSAAAQQYFAQFGQLLRRLGNGF